MKNKYEIRGNTTAIFIECGDNVIETIISTNKLDRTKEFPGTWRAQWSAFTQSYYAQGSYKKKAYRLNRWVLNTTSDDLLVDHRDHDTLNNTDENLREVTSSENQQNHSGPKSNNKSSGVRGVTWNAQHQKWQVRVGLDKKRTHVGYFKNLDDAEKAAIKARSILHPYSPEAEENKEEVMNFPKKTKSVKQSGIRYIAWHSRQNKWIVNITRFEGGKKDIYI